MHPIGVGDLYDLKPSGVCTRLMRRMRVTNPRNSRFIELGHHRLLAAPRQVGEPLEAWKDTPVFLREVEQRLEHGLRGAGDDPAMLGARPCRLSRAMKCTSDDRQR
jgi:hypothetical protein